MDAKNVVQVEIFGNSYTIRGDADQEYILEVAAYVDRKMRDVTEKVPVASLSGGQRQTVAIARSLLGDPKVVVLDEPTAALGVAQTAEVLNLVERLKDSGLGVIMISHNMVDVKAVADRVAVLRLGRNNGVFDAQAVSSEEIVAAITGATDNVVSQRAARRAAPSSATSSQEEQE